MLSRYHLEITKTSLGAFFLPPFLREIAQANVRQDSIASLFGAEAQRHVCDCDVVESFAYVDEEHAHIVELAQARDKAAEQRAAFGRLLHTVQDFYAHTNYVALWVAQRGDMPPAACHAHDSQHADAWRRAIVSEVRPDPFILCDPALQTAQWQTWRDPLYYVPGLGQLLRRCWLPASSHEAINLDSPKRGAYFHLAMAMARQRTLAEYARVVAALRAVGGMEAVARFHGAGNYVPQPLPVGA